jgi:hypothetical protein
MIDNLNTAQACHESITLTVEGTNILSFDLSLNLALLNLLALPEKERLGTSTV